MTTEKQAVQVDGVPLDSLGLPTLGGRWRLLAWLVALSLTATLLLYPVDMRLVSAPVQSAAVISNLPLFAVLYYAWLLVLLVLLLTRSASHLDHREQIAAGALFALVFWGFWTVNTPDGQSEEPSFLAYASYLEDTGRINLESQNFLYFDFPGIGIFAHSVSSVMDVSYLDARTIIMLSNAALTALFLYCLYERLAASSAKPDALYLLAAPMVIQSNMMLSVGFFFRPENAVGLLFLMSLLILLAANRDEDTFFVGWQRSLIAILLFTALTVTHFVTAVVFVVVLGGLYLMRAVDGHRMATASTIPLFLVMASTWLLYYASRTFETVADSVSYVADLAKGGDLLFYAFTLGTANAGGEVPLWATAVRLFWIGAVYVLAAFLAAWNLTRLRGLDKGQREYAGVLLSIGMLTVLVALVNGTGDQIGRYIQYGSYFAVPIVLAFVARTASRRAGLVLVTVPFFLLSLPTFLAYHSQIAVNAYYPQEHRAAQFLRAGQGDAPDPALFTGVRDRHLYLFYFPDGEFYSSTFSILKRSARELLWQDTGNLVSTFVAGSSGVTRERSVFVFSRGFQMTYEHLNGISPEDVEWLRVRAKLATTNAFYDNGEVQMYTPLEAESSQIASASTIR